MFSLIKIKDSHSLLIKIGNVFSNKNKEFSFPNKNKEAFPLFLKKGSFSG